MDKVTTLGDRVRVLRDKADLSLREFGEKLDVSAAFLSDVELGRRHPSDELLARMAKELGTTIEDLRKYDTRVPMEDLRRLAASNPLLGIALRSVRDGKVSAEDIMKIAGKKKGKE